MQARDDVARVLRRGEQPQLGAGAAGRRFDFWRRREDSLGDAHLPIGLVQGGATRREVVEHEGPFVHLGEKAGLDEPPQSDTDDDECHRRDHDPARMPQHRSQSPLIAVAQGIQCRLRSRERPGACRLDFMSGHELLGQQRDDREGKDQRNKHGHRQRGGQGGEELADDAL